MIVGWPGSFKTTICLNLMIGWARHGLTGLYISADDDAMGIAGRAGGILTGYPVDVVEEGLRDRTDYYVKSLDRLSALRFVFTAPDINEIDRHLRFFREMWGSFPDFMVVDNLLNISDSDGDWSELRNLTRDLALQARESETHTCILHHTSESVGQPGQPPPRYSIQGKVSQFPQLILSVGADGTRLNVAPVKNRHGPQDPTGTKINIPFQVFTDTMRVREMWADAQGTLGG